MLRDASEPGWHTPPPNEPPRDYAQPDTDDDPPHRGLHPIRKGLAAAWVVFGLFLASPLLIAATVAYAWWEVMRWITRT